MKNRIISIGLAFVLSCTGENPEYDLGFEQGCENGRYDAYNCYAKNPRIDGLEKEESEYAEGFYEGYVDCYDAAVLLSSCNDWQTNNACNACAE